MSNLLFTLYEADSDHLAIAWGPMPLEKAIVEATNLVAETASVFGATTEDERYEGIRQDWFAFDDSSPAMATGMDDMDADSRRMSRLCEWLDLRRNQAWADASEEPAYRYFYTEGAKQ